MREGVLCISRGRTFKAGAPISKGRGPNVKPCSSGAARRPLWLKPVTRGDEGPGPRVGVPTSTHSCSDLLGRLTGSAFSLSHVSDLLEWKVTKQDQPREKAHGWTPEETRCLLSQWSHTGHTSIPPASSWVVITCVSVADQGSLLETQCSRF